MPSPGCNSPVRNLLFFSFLVGHAFPKFGLTVAIATIFLSFDLIATFWGVVLIQLVGTLLFMIWIPVAAFQSVDRRMEEAARDVGASPLRVFWSITLPQAGADDRRGGPAVLRRHLLRDRGRLADRRAANPHHAGADDLVHQQPAGDPVRRGAVRDPLGPVLHRAAVRSPRHQLGLLRPRLWRLNVMAELEITDVTKIFGRGAVTAVDDFSLKVANGELVCLLGPSGSGKSTLLRMIGGFETPSAGRIIIDGEDVTARSAGAAADRHGVPEPRAVDAT